MRFRIKGETEMIEGAAVEIHYRPGCHSMSGIEI
jgi:hypothetical protein